MLTHVVIFRTRDASKAPLILEGLETLKQIDGVKFMHIGAPVPSARPVVDDFFDYALVMSFEDGAAGLKRYAEHPIHVNFVENYLKPAGGKLLVYDIGNA
ncbi:Dabb family protein [Opitutia bacterium KCR 482]|nr:Dabb family protein [Opitutae bacterium KCR 482]